jgi:hypothetical protein
MTTSISFRSAIANLTLSPPAGTRNRMPKPFSRSVSFRAIFKTIFLTVAPLMLISCSPANNKGSSDAAPSAAKPASASSTPSADSALPDPCQLLTKAEAEDILGEAIREPAPGSLGGNRICDYKTVTVHGGVLPYSIHIAVIGESQQTWDAGKKLHQQSDAKEMHPVSGIGDDAYYLLDDLDILTMQRYVTINVMKDIDKPNHAKAIHDAELVVAQKVLPRIQ